MNKKVGFIGTGYMGYGMVKNLLNNFEVYIIAHKNRKPIDRLKQIGAIEVDTYSDLCTLNLDCLFLCVTNRSWLLRGTVVASRSDRK